MQCYQREFKLQRRATSVHLEPSRHLESTERQREPHTERDRERKKESYLLIRITILSYKNQDWAIFSRIITSKSQHYAGAQLSHEIYAVLPERIQMTEKGNQRTLIDTWTPQRDTKRDREGQRGTDRDRGRDREGQRWIKWDREGQKRTEKDREG